MMRMGMDAVTFVSETLGRIADAPASTFADDSAAFRLTPVEDGHEFADALRLFAAAASDGIETAGPRYFGYIPSGGLYASTVADLLSCGLNRSTGLSGFSPALVAMEDGVIRWLCGQFGLPSTAGGVMTSGGSMGRPDGDRRRADRTAGGGLAAHSATGEYLRDLHPTSLPPDLSIVVFRGCACFSIARTQATCARLCPY